MAAHFKRHGRITTNEFQTAFSVAKRTASLDLAGQVRLGSLGEELDKLVFGHADGFIAVPKGILDED